MMNTVFKLSLALGILTLSLDSLYAGKWTKLQDEESRESLLMKIGTTAEAFEDIYLEDKTDLNQKKCTLWRTAETLVAGDDSGKSVTDLTKWLNDHAFIRPLLEDVKELKKTVEPKKEDDDRGDLLHSYGNMDSFNMNLYSPGPDLTEEDIYAKMDAIFKSSSNVEAVEVDTSFLDDDSGSLSHSKLTSTAENEELISLQKDLSNLSKKIDDLRDQLAVFEKPETEEYKAVEKAKTVDKRDLSREARQYFHKYQLISADLERAEETKAEYEEYLKKLINQ